MIKPGAPVACVLLAALLSPAARRPRRGGARRRGRPGRHYPVPADGTPDGDHHAASPSHGVATPPPPRRPILRRADHRGPAPPRRPGGRAAGMSPVVRTLARTSPSPGCSSLSSGDLTIHGFLNVPHGEGPFPVAIVLHGYIDPAIYQTLAYTTRYADALARRLRPSTPTCAGIRPPTRAQPLRGDAEDVLNLLALVRGGGGDGPAPPTRRRSASWATRWAADRTAGDAVTPAWGLPCCTVDIVTADEL